MRFTPLLVSLALCTAALSASFGSCLNGYAQCAPTPAVLPALDMVQDFRHPGFEARPWCFWYWMYGAVNKSAITADLEAMKRVGLAGTYLMPIKGPKQFPQDSTCIDQQSPEWWSMVDHALHEADRLGLKLGMHICDGFALAGGPWILPQESMQKVVWSDTLVATVPRKDALMLPRPVPAGDYYEDVAVLAWQEPYDASLLVDHEPAITEEALPNGKAMLCTFAHPVRIQNLHITPKGNNYQAQRLQLYTSANGKDYTHVKTFTPPRQGWQNTDFGLTFTFAPTRCQYAKLVWTPEGSEPGSEDLDAAKWKPNLKIKRLRFSSQPRLNQWEGKTGLVWRVAQDSNEDDVPASLCIDPNEVRDVTPWLHDDALTHPLPKPRKGYGWHVLRLGHTTTGHTNATGGTCQGLECSKLDAAAVEKQIAHWFGAVFEHTDRATAQRVLKYMHIDSWECGCQNWSAQLLAEFQRRRGYDFKPYRPLLAGIPMVDAATSERVLRDYRTTIAELIHDVFYDVAARMADAYDCQLTAECVAPTMVSDGMLHYDKVDFPMGEFWLGSPTHDKPNDMLDAISGGHVYGKNIIQAEGCTQLRGTWDESPATVKPLIDQNLALGINRLFFHVFTLNPYMDRQPGMTLDGIGFFFQRDNTWFDQSAGLTQYVGRCQALLQYGRPVVDLAVFTGEEMPRRSILPHRLVSTFPGLMGKDRVEREHRRLQNVGQPLRTQPVGVSHSANMADPQDWVNPLHGYQYDSFNRDALLRLASGKDHKLVLDHGMCYQALVLPQARPMTPNKVCSDEVRQKVEELRRAGVTVIDSVITTATLASLGIAPDVIVPEGVAFAHRTGAEADVYFLVNTTAQPLQLRPSFRVDATSATLWDAMNGEITQCPVAPEAGHRSCVSFTLGAHESRFVVFGKGTAADALLQLAQPCIATDTAYVIRRTAPWSLDFTRIEASASLDTLSSWTQLVDVDPRMVYYSGTVQYSTTFTHIAPQPGHRYFLQFEGLHDLATVELNDMPCGTVWTAPYEIEITQQLCPKGGSNRLRLYVTNTWANALLGADQGKAPFPNIWTNAKYRNKPHNLIPAGLVCEPKVIVR